MEPSHKPAVSLRYLRFKSFTSRHVASCTDLDTLHRDVVDHPNDAAGPGDSQQRVAGVGVVRPRTRVKVLIGLRA